MALLFHSILADRLLVIFASSAAAGGQGTICINRDWIGVDMKKDLPGVTRASVRRGDSHTQRAPGAC